MLHEYNDILLEIDLKILNTATNEIPSLLKDIPLPVFGELTLQEQEEYKSIKEYLPPMASEDIQTKWTGSHGRVLLSQSVAFINDVIDFYKIRTGKSDLSNTNVLDFGCGWGRLIRLLYKFISEQNIYAIDAWDQSLQICKEDRVRANFAKADQICKTIPFGAKFDLIISFSVFSHLSKRSSDAALKAMREVISDDGILVLTIRPCDFWKWHVNIRKTLPDINGLIDDHINHGFAYAPHLFREPFDGDYTYGDTSISIEYIQNNWTSWQIVDYKINFEDQFQAIVYLKPV